MGLPLQENIFVVWPVALFLHLTHKFVVSSMWVRNLQMLCAKCQSRKGFCRRGVFPNKVLCELCGGFFRGFFGPFSLEKQEAKIHPKIHGKIQIRIWEFRGQNPHCKDLALNVRGLDSADLPERYCAMISFGNAKRCHNNRLIKM